MTAVVPGFNEAEGTTTDGEGKKTFLQQLRVARLFQMRHHYAQLKQRQAEAFILHPGLHAANLPGTRHILQERVTV